MAGKKGKARVSTNTAKRSRVRRKPKKRNNKRVGFRKLFGARGHGFRKLGMLSKGFPKHL